MITYDTGKDKKQVGRDACCSEGGRFTCNYVPQSEYGVGVEIG
jgi:hypothetical protein